MTYVGEGLFPGDVPQWDGDVWRTGPAVELYQVIKDSSTIITSSPTVVSGWDRELRRDNGTAPITLNSPAGEFTVNKDGFYALSCRLVAAIDVTINRKVLTIDIEVDDGGGFVAQAGALESQYNLRNGVTPLGSAQINDFIIELTAGDVFRFVAESTATGTMVVDADNGVVGVKYYGP